ncbi:hypothetical protein [Brumicola pallidula]|uniref:Apea-like HEPN domain-containing protein n=1 Tax=Brumicola pallidula DSM 14239 = ACAM 615 TaxID=1121922 RepID=K6ZI77_9ALTE|nr:hypothetical protein [Glaciecola pallidula]GAC28598.1 hypothetical protein GPAL_1735 [Glaciecola pallidula DSM 14239 = ACAM 615]
MKIKVKKEFNLSIVLAQVRASLPLNGEGNVTTEDLSIYPNIKDLLLNIFVFPPRTKHLNLEFAVSTALHKYLRSDDKSDNHFIETLKATCLSELQKQEEEYTLLTSISLSHENLRGFNVKLLDCQIQFHHHSPSHLTHRSKVLLEQGSQISKDEMPSGYTIVTVLVRSRYCKEAMERALEALDVIRGLINLDVNASDLLFGNEWQPVNKVMYGKIHTLHDKTGVALSRPVYFEPNFVNRVPINYSNDALLRKNVTYRLVKMKQIGFAENIVGAMIRFARALDEPDNNIAVIKLWATFETLLLVNGEDRSKISKMLSALHSNAEIEWLYLENIRLYRNTNVHSGLQDNSPIRYSYRLQNNFIVLINYYLLIKHTSLKEANQDLLLASKGKSHLDDELERTKRVFHIFKDIF